MKSNSAPSQSLRFPPGFLFGAATAAHQVEGHNDLSDWWDFEQKPGRIKDGARSGTACENYQRFEADLDLLVALGLKTYRFSIEWARVESTPGLFDQTVLEHYRNVLLACIERQIVPQVTLYHFTLPRWFAQRGGWLASDSSHRFRLYVAEVARALGPLVPFWVTINEPMVLLYQGYVEGIWPPEVRNFRKMLAAGRNLLRAHFEAAHVIANTPGPKNQLAAYGLANHIRIFDGAREGSRLDALAASTQDYLFNWAFLDSVRDGRFRAPFGAGESIVQAKDPGQTFFGVNYYSRGRVRFDLTKPAAVFGSQDVTRGAPTNELGWEIYPEGLLRVLRTVDRRYGLPTWITENGTADQDDRFRAAFLVHHLAQVARALQEGLRVEGYQHWSLYDNFEWAEGYSARFGLYSVDFSTQVRTPRHSATIYSQIARTLELPETLLKTYRF